MTHIFRLLASASVLVIGVSSSSAAEPGRVMRCDLGAPLGTHELVLPQLGDGPAFSHKEAIAQSTYEGVSGELKAHIMADHTAFGGPQGPGTVASKQTFPQISVEINFQAPYSKPECDRIGGEKEVWNSNGSITKKCRKEMLWSTGTLTVTPGGTVAGDPAVGPLFYVAARGASVTCRLIR